MKNIHILILVLFLSACGNDNKLEFEDKQYISSELAGCEEDICPEINIQLLQAQGNSKLADVINTTTNAVVAQSLSISPDQESEIKTIEEGIKQFIDDFRAAKNEFPDNAATDGYEFTTTSGLSFESTDLLSIKLDSYSYWGGAHGYSDTKYLNFDRKNNRYLNNEELIKNREKFNVLAEKLFRKQQHIPEDANINESGYFFEDDVFALPNTIGFDEEYMILIYNPYEVAPYAEGQIILEIPQSEVASYLSITL